MIVLIVCGCLLGPGFEGATSQAQGNGLLPAATYPNCRFGITVGNNFTPFVPTDLASLRAGWYVNWHADESAGAPASMEHVNLVRLQANGLNSYISSPSLNSIGTVVQSKPGEIWFIGNEPDSPFQDELVATVYADAYFDLYHAIKVADPTAKVGIGAIVQPTPLRFQYLDIIWTSYFSKYGEFMPVDIWNIHAFILKEISGNHPRANNGDPLYDVWGAFIPPGPEFAGIVEGVLTLARDMDDLAIFQARIIAFRTWMAQHGQREKPLYITEFGVLFPPDYVDEDGVLLSDSRVANFMQGTFNFMHNTTSQTLGYPQDENRLVQRWAWFSLDGQVQDWGGSLFNVQTGNIRSLGQTYRNYTAALPPATHLQPVQTNTSPAVRLASEGNPNFTLQAKISNSGNISISNPITVNFYQGLPDNPGPQIGSPQLINTLAGCGDYATVSVTWNNLPIGANHYHVQIQSADDPAAPQRILVGTALVATEQVHLPVTVR